MNRWWFLRVHRDVCRQNDDLHASVRQLTYERDDALALVVDLRAELEASGELVRVLMQATPSDLRAMETG